MLDLIGAVVGMSAVTINLVAVMHTLPATLARRLGVAAIAGAWVGLASGLGAAGKLAVSADVPLPLIGVLFALPLLTVGALAFWSRSVRATLLAIPMPVLIGLNSLRILGVLFLFLAAAGRLSGPFPFFAGIGDIITGVAAIPLALRVARSGHAAGAVRSWNMFGAADLLLAVGLGITSAVGSPLQMIHTTVGSYAIQYLPYCLVPTVLVPFYLITHATVAAQLAVATRAAPTLSHA